MDFQLKSLSEAFKDRDFQKNRQYYLLYSFFLATTADRDIFPDIIQHYIEIDELTSKGIIIIMPQLKARSESDFESIISIIRSKEYDNPTRTVAKTVRDFINRQDREVPQFARYYDVTDKLPCILFFDSLDKPESFIIWPLQGKDANSVVRDLRKISTIIERRHRNYINLHKELSELKSQKKHERPLKHHAVNTSTDDRISEIEGRLLSSRPAHPLDEIQAQRELEIVKEFVKCTCRIISPLAGSIAKISLGIQ